MTKFFSLFNTLRRQIDLYFVQMFLCYRSVSTPLLDYKEQSDNLLTVNRSSF